MTSANQTPRFLLVYGSQTGQSKAIAEEIFEQSSEHGFDADIQCFSSYGTKFTFETERLAVIVTSSTGDGEPPDTVQKFYRRIFSKDLSPTHLRHFSYALLGLGDSNYTSFHNCPKSIDRRLSELGSKRFYPSGYADDATGLEVVVEPWVSGLFPALKSYFEAGKSTEAVLLQCIAQCSLNEKAEPLHDEVAAGANTQAASCASSDTRASDYAGAAAAGRTAGCTEVAALGKVLVCETSTKEKKLLPTAAPALAAASLIDDDHEMNRVRQTFLHGTTLTLPSLPAQLIKVSALGLEARITDADVGRRKAGVDSPDVVCTTVTRARVLTGPLALKKTLLLEMDLRDTNLSYEPGDTFGLSCENDPAEIGWLLRRLGVSEEEADCPLDFTPVAGSGKKIARIPDHLISHASLRQVFKYCVEIRAVPKKAFLCLIADYTSDADERQRLKELSSREGSKDYTEIVLERSVSVLDILSYFPSCRPPIEVLLGNLPSLQPRSYSAASSPLKKSNSLEIVFNIMHMRPLEGHPRTGVCTGWLNQLTSHLHVQNSCDDSTALSLPKVYVFPRKSKNFRLPHDVTTPLLLICAGTGISPFIGFFEQRYHQRLADPDIHQGNLSIFYGCRNPSKDFLFRDTLVDMVRQHILSKCVVCFSDYAANQLEQSLPSTELAASGATVTGGQSDLANLTMDGPASVAAGAKGVSASTQDTSEDRGDPTSACVQPPLVGEARCCHSTKPLLCPGEDGIISLSGYVQDGLTADIERIAEMVWTAGASVYICGSSAMAKGVLAVMTVAASKAKGVSTPEASALIKELRLNKRYLEDVWS